MRDVLADLGFALLLVLIGVIVGRELPRAVLVEVTVQPTHLPR